MHIEGGGGGYSALFHLIKCFNATNCIEYVLSVIFLKSDFAALTFFLVLHLVTLMSLIVISILTASF